MASSLPIGKHRDLGYFSRPPALSRRAALRRHTPTIDDMSDARVRRRGLPRHHAGQRCRPVLRPCRQCRSRGLPLPRRRHLEVRHLDRGRRAGQRLAAGLISLGLEHEERVGIASGTRYEWILSDLAIMCAGGATTTVYPTTIAEDRRFILSDSESRVVFAEDDAQIAKLREKGAELPTSEGRHLRRHRRRRLGDRARRPRADGREALAEHARRRRGRRRASADHLATLIYTSGTTGRPKGVRLKHSSWTYEGAAIGAQRILAEDDLQYLWLPMAHSFGKVLISTQLACGFPTAIDGRVDKIVDNLAVVKPTFMGAAPRIFEKAHGRIVTMTAAEGGARRRSSSGRSRSASRSTGSSARASRPAAAEAAARALRQAGLRQGARPLRWPGPLLHLRSRRAQPRGRGVVPRRRHPHPRGLRPDRDLRRRLRQPPRPLRFGTVGLPSPAQTSRSPRTARS